MAFEEDIKNYERLLQKYQEQIVNMMDRAEYFYMVTA